MADRPQNFSKMISSQLRTTANEFLSNRKNANKLAEILHMFEVRQMQKYVLLKRRHMLRLQSTSAFVLFQVETDNYTPLLLTIEVIFSELLKRGDLVQNVVPLKPEG